MPVSCLPHPAAAAAPPHLWAAGEIGVLAAPAPAPARAETAVVRLHPPGRHIPPSEDETRDATDMTRRRGYLSWRGATAERPAFGSRLRLVPVPVNEVPTGQPAPEASVSCE